MVKNAYIHIPFCKSKCKYCSFISYPCISLKDDFLCALKREIKHYYKGEKLNTLYFGGGTPSVLDVKDFEDIISLFNFEQDAEITTELNPETLTEDYLKSLRKIGINRISLGCQTFDDEILKFIGRRHNAKAVVDAVHSAKAVGFENISLDFIYGLPNQTREGFEKDLLKAVELGVQHISLYGLKIEEGCEFYEQFYHNLSENLSQNLPPLPDEDEQADMYLKAIEVMRVNDFEHYEISNFSKKGFNSRHNLNYWNNNTYYGFGVAAHGYVDGVRYSNQTLVEKYIENPIEKELEHAETVTEIFEEEIFLGFRKGEGINVEKINQKFNINFDEKFSKILGKYQQYLLKTPTGYKFTDEGFMVSNVILSEFLQ